MSDIPPPTDAITGVERDVRALYEALPPCGPGHGHLLPHVGAAFTGADSTALRMMAIGVNAYGGEHEEHAPERWARAFRSGRWRFHRRVLEDLRVLADGLAGSEVTGAREFHGVESVYLMNAVKRWLPGATKADRVDEEWFREGVPVLHAELDALARADRLPHLVVVAGRRPWDHVRPAFKPSASAWAAEYARAPEGDELFHQLRLVQVRENGATRPLLLVCMRHPTGGWGARWSPRRLLAHPTFRRVAGLPPAP
jgi:hypothetical protein